MRALRQILVLVAVNVLLAGAAGAEDGSGAVSDEALLDLVNSGYVSAAGYVAGVGVSRTDAPRMNDTLDPYVTDGLRAVLALSETTREFSDIAWIDWETPPARSGGFVAEQ